MDHYLAVAGVLTAVFGAAWAASAAGAATIAVVNAVIVAGLSVLSQSLLNKKPKSLGAASDSPLMIRQSNFPRRIAYGKSRLGGIWFYANTTGGRNRILHLVLGICEGPIEAVDEIYFGDELIAIDANGDVTTEKYLDHARIKIHLGDQTTADADLVAEDANWTSDHKLLGIAYVYLRLKHDSQVWDSGLPEISFVIRGANDVVDTRDGTAGYTNNTALCAKHYFTRARTGPGLDPEKVDYHFTNDAAVVCDEAVPLKDGGTEARYALDGSFLLDQSPEEIVASMVESMAGWQIYTGGKFRLYAGYYIPPEFEINEDMIVAEVNVRHKKTRSARVNTIKGLYKNPENDWQSTDFPTVKDQQAIDIDGIEHLSDLELPFTISHTRAQRLAKIDLKRSRLEKSLTIVCNLRAFPVQAGENIKLTIDYLGFSGKEFYVDKASLGVHNDAPVIVLELVETGSEVYDWIPSIDEGGLANPGDISIDAPEIILTVSPLPGDVEVPMAWFDDGKNQQLTVSHGAGFDFLHSANAWSIVAWFIEDGSTDNLATLLAQGASDLSGITDAYALTVTDDGGTSRLQGHIADGGNVIQDDGQLVTQDDGQQVVVDHVIRSVGPATVIPAGELIMVAMTFDGVDTLRLWADSKDSAYAIDTTIATVQHGVAESEVDHSAGTANDLVSSLIGRMGGVAMYSDELDTAALEALFAQGVIGQVPFYDDLSAGQLTNLEHYWNLEELTGGRIDSEAGATFVDSGSVGVGAHKGVGKYPLALTMEASDPESDILWVESTTIDFVPKKNEFGAQFFNLYPPASVSAANKRIVARAVADTTESPNFIAYYGFDYAFAGNILLWLDSKYGVELDGSGNLEYWRDQSPAGNDAFQASAGSRPALIQGVHLGFPAIRFDGTDDFMLFPQPLNGSQARSVYFVIKSTRAPTADQNENVLVDFQDGAAPASGEMWALGIERDVRTIAASDKFQSHNSDLTGARFYAVSVHFSGSTLEDDTDLRVFGDNRAVVDTASETINTAATTNAVLGKSNALAGSHLLGDLLELMVIDHQNGGRSKELVHQYLAGKYSM